MSDRVSSTAWRLIRPDGNLLWTIIVPSLYDGAVPTPPVRFGDLSEAIHMSTVDLPVLTFGPPVQAPVMPPWIYQRQVAGGDWETIAEVS
jgi:hypothetical protein